MELLVPTIRSVELREELERILASKAFASAGGLKNFLQFVVQEALEGRGEQIKESCIGKSVYRRGEAFDPRQDNIVRTEAWRLRARLAKYYETEGARDRVRIELHKGTYAPAFCLNPGFSSLIQEQVEPKEQPSRREAAPTAQRRILSWKVAAVALLAMVLTVVLAAAFYKPGFQRIQPSVAVLPFVNLSDNQGNDFFSDGLTDELIDSLGRVPGLHVVARSSTFQYKGKPLDIREIGRRLNVRTVLEGSVRKSGSRIRVAVELEDASSGYHLWSESYDRELEDTLVIQRDISDAITNTLGLTLARHGWPELKTFANGSAALDPDAYEDYLKGRFYLNKVTPADNQTAMQYFNRSIASNPNYAPAYVGLADCYATAHLFDTVPLPEIIRRMREYASKALELDGTLGEAHTTLGYAFVLSFNWVAAEPELKKGLELNPGNALAHEWYGEFLNMVGSVQQGFEQSRIALELDPLSPFATQAVAMSLRFLRRKDEAIRQYQSVLSLDPTYWLAHHGLGLMYFENRDYSKAIAEMDAARQFAPQSQVVLGQMGYLYGTAGYREKAQQILDELLNNSRQGHASAAGIARVYLGLGQKDLAFEWFHRAIDQRDMSLYLKSSPQYDVLRSDPRFGELLRQMNLP